MRVAHPAVGMIILIDSGMGQLYQDFQGVMVIGFITNLPLISGNLLQLLWIFLTMGLSDPEQCGLMEKTR
jgi:hypothetical protein